MKSAKIIINSNEKGSECELIIFGDAYFDEKGAYVEYKEADGVGMGDVTTKMSIYENALTIARFGDTKMDMNFELDKACPLKIDTQFGVLDAFLTTSRLDISKNEKETKIDVDYSILFMQDTKVDHQIKIRIEFIGE